MPSTDDFTFKERPTGNIGHDAFQERGRLSKETLSWHQQMLNGRFGGWVDVDAFEVNLLTGRMTNTWGDDPLTPIAVDGRCFSTKYADRMRIRASR